MHGMLSAAIVIGVFAVCPRPACTWPCGCSRPEAGPEIDMAIHPELEPLSFLLGRWEGAGIGGYPTIESFRFGQGVSFSHNGKPFLIYTSRTWRLDEEGVPGRPLGMETGFWRPQPEGRLEVLLAHPTGITEI